VWIVDHGLWTMDPSTVDYALWSMDRGLWTMDHWLWTMGHRTQVPSPHHPLCFLVLVNKLIPWNRSNSMKCIDFHEIHGFYEMDLLECNEIWWTTSEIHLTSWNPRKFNEVYRNFMKSKENKWNQCKSMKFIEILWNRIEIKSNPRKYYEIN